ncbi:hypothetical protein Ancab_020768 [Ancistrocladus abbreviatus]
MHTGPLSLLFSVAAPAIVQQCVTSREGRRWGVLLGDGYESLHQPFALVTGDTEKKRSNGGLNLKSNNEFET